MTNLITQWKQGAGQAWAALAEGWHDLAARAGSALTRFRRHPQPESDDPRDAAWLADGRWAVMAADVFDDDDRVVVRIEAPGLRRDDFQIELNDEVLTVSGEKRFERESTQGRYRVVQCAYGSFRREVPLPPGVKPGQASASYRDGVLRVDIPKDEAVRSRRLVVQGD